MKDSKFLKSLIPVLLSSVVMAILQGIILYFFFFDFFVSYTPLSQSISLKFFKYLLLLCSFSFLIGLFCFSFGKRVSRSILCQWVIVFGFFVLTFITRKIEGVFIFPHEGFIESKILLWVWIIWIASVVLLFSCNFEIKKISWLGVISIIICGVISFPKQGVFRGRDRLYFQRGSLGLFVNTMIFHKETAGIEENIQRNKIIDSNKKILFMHFPKTGGSSIANIAEHYPSINESIERIKQQINKGFDVIKNKTVLQVHITRAGQKDLGLGRATTFTFFRDPKERLISKYYFNKEKDNLNIGLLEYLQQSREEGCKSASGGGYLYYISKNPKEGEPSESNVSEAIKFLDNFEFIGFMNNYEEDFGELCDFLYIPRPHKAPKNNVTKNKEKIVMSPEIERELDRLTKYDYIIYEAAKKVAARKRKECKEYGNGVCRMRIN